VVHLLGECLLVLMSTDEELVFMDNVSEWGFWFVDDEVFQVDIAHQNVFFAGDIDATERLFGDFDAL